MRLDNEAIKRLQTDYASRKINRRQFTQGLVALGIGGVLAAAIEKGASAAPGQKALSSRVGAQDPETLVIAVAENIDTFDPGFTVGSKSSQTIIQNVFDQLTQYEIVDATTPDGTPYKTVNTENIIGMLAESWEWDGNDMVFTLRDDIKYHNGNPMTGQTFVDGYTRILESGAIAAFLLGMGGALTSAEQLSVNDAGQFVISLTQKNPITPLNNVMHNTAVLDPAQVAEVATEDDPWGLEYFKANLGIGNGPYRLDSYTPDDQIVLVADENYYGEKPYFKTVIMKIVADATQRVQLLRNGDVDSATKIPFPEYEALSQDENVQTLSIPSNLIVMIEMNNLIPPFDQKEVRQAVAYATPYADILEQIYLGQAAEAKSIVPTGMPTHDPSTNQYSYNLEKAKELLAAAGYPNGDGLPEIKITVAGDDQQKERIAIIMQDSLSQIGMKVSIEKLAYAQFNELQQGSKLQMWTDEWLSWVNDPYYHMFWLAQTESPSNYPKFSNPRVDEILDTYMFSDDAEARAEASKEAQAIIIEECPYVFLAQPNWIIYFGNDIDGYVYYNDELPRYGLLRRVTS
jgi:peptide/nickel transport system substrate-binding protein